MYGFSIITLYPKVKVKPMFLRAHFENLSTTNRPHFWGFTKDMRLPH